MQTVNLSCRCGSVRLRVNTAPIAQFYCHCDDCRAVTGGAFVPMALFPTDMVAVSGGDTTFLISKACRQYSGALMDAVDW